MDTGQDGDVRALRSLVGMMMQLHSAHDHTSVLEAIVVGVCDALGYGMAAIRVLDDDREVLNTAAVVGPADAVAAMKGRSLPLVELAMEFEWADRDGDVHFVPHERLPEDIASTWVPTLDSSYEPGDWHPMDALYVTLHDHEGQLLGVLGVDLPADGRRPNSAQRELLQLSARLAAGALDRSKLLDQQANLVAALTERQQESMTLVTTLAHDLKGPLTVILSYADLARDEVSGPTSEALVSRLDGIERGVERMSSAISDLLEQRHTNLDARAAARDETPVDLAVLALEVVTVYRVVAERRDLTLALELVGDNRSVLGDRRQLQSAIDNLVSNALKYTPPGGRVVVMVEGNGSEVRLTCADNGVGIAPEDHEAMFDDYTRAAQVQAAGIEGTGLGLPSARRIVTAHGGTLTLTSALGAGSTFEAVFPRVVDPSR